MKFPFPLRFTIPATLFLFGVFLGALSLAYEVTSSYHRIEEDVGRRAVFLGNQISEMLRHHFTQGDIEGALREWQNALKVDPNHANTRKAMLKARGESLN